MLHKIHPMHPHARCTPHARSPLGGPIVISLPIALSRMDIFLPSIRFKSISHGICRHGSRLRKEVKDRKKDKLDDAMIPPPPSAPPPGGVALGIAEDRHGGAGGRGAVAAAAAIDKDDDDRRGGAGGHRNGDDLGAGAGGGSRGDAAYPLHNDIEAVVVPGGKRCSSNSSSSVINVTATSTGNAAAPGNAG